MTQTIVTGPFPGQPGACIAQYNHFTYSHSSHHHSSHHHSHNHNPNHIMPYIQQPITVHGHYGIPSWRPPGASFPSFY